MYIRLLLIGLTADREDGDLIEVVRIRHQAEDFGQTWYSIALRMPLFGCFSNRSKWWVFYKVYAVDMPDPEVVRTERQITDTLIEFDDNINRIELDVSTRDLLDLCEPPAWRHVFTQARELIDVNSQLRGDMSELLAAVLLEAHGYRNLRLSFKPRLLAGKELDFVGIKQTSEECECLIVEAKGGTTIDTELEEEIEEFTTKIDFLEANLTEFGGEIGCAGPIDRIRARFISLAYPGEFRWGEDKVELWFYDRFLSELKRARIPTRYTDQLRPTTIATTIDPFDDSWFETNEGAKFGGFGPFGVS